MNDEKFFDRYEKIIVETSDDNTLVAIISEDEAKVFGNYQLRFTTLLSDEKENTK